jgi:hypothetical protein
VLRHPGFAFQESTSRHWLVVLELLQRPEESVVLEVDVIVAFEPGRVALQLVVVHELVGCLVCLRRVRH